MKLQTYWNNLAEGESRSAYGTNTRSIFARNVSDKIEREKKRAARPESETIDGEIIEENQPENVIAAELIFGDDFEALDVESYEVEPLDIERYGSEAFDIERYDDDSML